MSKSFQDYISKPGIQDFILEHEDDDVQKFLLKQKHVLGVPAGWIAQQLIARSKAKYKLPTWYRTPGIVFPPALSLEQASSEVTARFKSTLIPSTSVVADLTGGLGIDSFFLSQHAVHLDCVEPNADLLEIARHNHRVLGAKNIAHHINTAKEFLSQAAKLDLVYLDPSRRKRSQKVHRFSDCEPNVIDLMDQLFEKVPDIMIKASPLLDIHQAVLELGSVTKVVVLAVENECRELLFLLRRGALGDPVINPVNLGKDGHPSDSNLFTWAEEKNSKVVFSEPLAFLYEPNAAIMKSGAFKWIAQTFKVKKLASNSHLYTSDHRQEFPGRIFRVTEQVKLDKKLKDRFSGGYVNILARNYPLGVEEIKKKTGLREGGDQYLIATQSVTEKHVLIAERVK
jgi:hypothetical protein